MTGPTPQQNRLEIKKQTKTTPSKKKCWGEAKKFLFCVAEKANLATVISNQVLFFCSLN